MSSYVQQRRNYSEDKLSDVYLGQTQENENMHRSFENLSGTLSEKGSATMPLVAGKDLNGFQSRTSDIGRVIPQQEILSRIVPFWELFISSVGLFGYHIITLAAHNIGGKRPFIVLFFNGCKSEFQQPNVDICATSILTWSLTGGALIYFLLTSILAWLLYRECHKHGYPGAFTALWNSPFFLFCYFFKEQNRIDLLTVPNRFMKFRKWTYLQFHRFALATYSLITTLLVVYYLTRKTVDNDDLIIQKDYKNGDKFYRIYNPYFLPYYGAIYFYCKTIISSGLDIRNLSNNDSSELVGIHYMRLRLK
ncbi:hypothetical protein C2G38_2253991 [Gigaspora rosea]|uniref:Uncharacterized protein n=1 Tax=Gigaspora rosea TaxID=44941 RepID=A0A397U498_9GLOM|nr:hypothetical protein C2G38_2253991 [Gigaspora rosea]CAG8648999.1 16828_t:CDS:2 [Gigaspora rosea]